MELAAPALNGEIVFHESALPCLGPPGRQCDREEGIRQMWLLNSPLLLLTSCGASPKLVK